MLKHVFRFTSNKKHRILGVLCLLALMLVVCVVVSILRSSNYLTTRQFNFSTDKIKKDAGSLKLVILSDLHNHEFGSGNEQLIKKVREQSPNLILLVGDFLNESSESADVVCELAGGLCDIAPVYLALGNHEEVYMEENGVGLIQELTVSGAVVLEQDYVDLDVNGTALRLGGMYGYAFGAEQESGENIGAFVNEERGNFLKEFQDTDRLKIMISHRPDSFIFGDASSYWDIDLVVSGHNHGGQIVIPFLGGLYGGDQGWFPKYVHGMYQKDDMNLFITSGLGSNKQMLPRMNNLPEIAVVTVHGK